MLIDWFTVCAQIVNFLVLVALLKHFLYGPILRAMDAREQTIAGRLAEAQQKAAGGPDGRAIVPRKKSGDRRQDRRHARFGETGRGCPAG